MVVYFIKPLSRQPFTISDLGQSFQGQLDVTVEEEDGRTSTFRVGSASIPYLTRKGQMRYKTSLGKPTSVGHNDINNPFSGRRKPPGWLNNVSLYGGGMFTADDYQAITTGIGFNLNQFGSLSLMSPEQTRLCRNKIATICVVTAIASTMQSISNRQVVRLHSRVIASQIKITCR